MKYMIGLDGSDNGHKAFLTAQRLAKEDDIIYLTTVVRGPEAGESSQGVKDDAIRLILNYEALCKAGNNKYESIVVQGTADTRESLLNMVDKYGIDVLVLGTRGLSTIKKMVLGSVSSYCVQNCPCDVLVVNSYNVGLFNNHKAMGSTTKFSEDVLGSLFKTQATVSGTKGSIIEEEGEEYEEYEEYEEEDEENEADVEELNSDFLSGAGIKYLYHFTDERNKNSIAKNGLLSWSTLIKEDYDVIYNSNNLSRKLDKKSELETYVRLSFTKNHPMMFVAKKEGRINNTFVIAVSLDVVDLPGVKFSDQNATKTGATIKQTPNHINFDIVKQLNHFNLNSNEKPFYQAEVLIPNIVSPMYFNNL